MKFTRERLFIVALLAAVAFLSFRGCMRKAEKVTEIRDVVVQKSDSLNHYKDAAGREHARRVQAEASLATVKLIYGSEMDSMKDVLGVRSNQLQGFVTAATEATGSGRLRIDTVYRDTIPNYRFSYGDRWLTISGEVSATPTLSYEYRDSLNVAFYTKRRWLLGRKETFVDAWSKNPSVHITGLNSVRVAGREPGRFGIGPYLGYGWNGTGWAPSAGISIQYSIIRF